MSNINSPTHSPILFHLSLSHDVHFFFLFFFSFSSPISHFSHTIISLFHENERFFVKRLKRLNRERIKKYENKYYLNGILIINS
jgi:hypothetical protein